jgi:xanthine dehydrogenase accessory factor
MPSEAEVLEQVVKRCDAGERVSLCTVVGARGSTPQAAGARMLVLAGGQSIGTLGGGCVEAEVRQQALKLLQNNLTQTLTFKLDHDYGWDDGLICGGTMDILVQTLDSQAAAASYRSALDSLRRGAPANIKLTYQLPESTEERAYEETIEPPAKLLIVGAGHVGQALAAIATPLDFRVSVLDDRTDCASVERFPSAETRLVGEIEDELRKYPIDATTYVVIVTRGHRHDGRALAAVIDSPAKYVGLIGSRRKVKTIYDDLIEQGVSREKLSRVHAPIGLELGAVTVPEIAVSIAAELITVRRGRDGQPAKPMKFDLATAAPTPAPAPPRNETAARK